jgi:two-component system, OmpR family, KDP operon response regulator KdpE
VTKILVVDDEPQILRVLRINLVARQYEVVTAATGAAALDSAKTDHPDLIILDLGLPDLDGVEVIRRLRAWTQVPIIVLSGRVDSRDKVHALDAGADDYVTKPFSVDELLARIRVVTRRRTDTDQPSSVRIGRYLINLALHQVELADSADPVSSDPVSADSDTAAEAGPGAVHLTRTEWQLLEAVVREPGKLVGQRYLLEKVWGPTYRAETQYVRQYMAQLRRKLEEDPARPRHLLTEPGMGYRFQP